MEAILDSALNGGRLDVGDTWIISSPDIEEPSYFHSLKNRHPLEEADLKINSNVYAILPDEVVEIYRISSSWPLSTRLLAKRSEKTKPLQFTSGNQWERRSDLERHPVKVASQLYLFFQTEVRDI